MRAGASGLEARGRQRQMLLDEIGPASRCRRPHRTQRWWSLRSLPPCRRGCGSCCPPRGSRRRPSCGRRRDRCCAWHPPPRPSRGTVGQARATRHIGIRARSATGSVARGGQISDRTRGPYVFAACPSLVSQEPQPRSKDGSPRAAPWTPSPFITDIRHQKVSRDHRSARALGTSRGQLTRARQRMVWRKRAPTAWPAQGSSCRSRSRLRCSQPRSGCRRRARRRERIAGPPVLEGS